MQKKKKARLNLHVFLSLLSVRGPLVRVVVEEPLDEVDVGHEHAAAAVALQAQRVEGVAVFSSFVVEVVERERGM